MAVTEVDYLIVGQGIAGTIISYQLLRRGYTVHLIDDGYLSSSTTKAAGIINPITGRSYVKSWRIDELMPVAIDTYHRLGKMLNGTYYLSHKIVRVLNSVADENKWASREVDPSYQSYIDDKKIDRLHDVFANADHYAVINGGRLLTVALLNDWREYLISIESYTESTFHYNRLDLSHDHIIYEDVTADRIVFCEGYRSTTNPYFLKQCFQPSKGEVLIIAIDDYPIEHIVKHGIFVCPIENDLYWVGSGYDNNYNTIQPTDAGRARLQEQLDSVLNLEYKVIEHIAGVRPSVRDRKPLLGPSAKDDRVYIFGGLGTKGSSLAPYWAEHLVNHFTEGTEIDAEVDINRF